MNLPITVSEVIIWVLLGVVTILSTIVWKVIGTFATDIAQNNELLQSLKTEILLFKRDTEVFSRELQTLRERQNAFTTELSVLSSSIQLLKERCLERIKKCQDL